MEVLFERIGTDLIGAISPERSADIALRISLCGYRSALVLVDYATHDTLEAVAMRNISAKSVAQTPFQVQSRNPPKEILTAQGTQFMSRTRRELYGLLASVHHPQTDGLVERLKKTLKSMIRKCINGDELKWA